MKKTIVNTDRETLIHLVKDKFSLSGEWNSKLSPKGLSLWKIEPSESKDER